MVGEITYSYTPEDWCQERFLELGGFTVVFLNYNKARWIHESVASALNQDFERLEMFFMDDASTDGSGDTMEQLVRQYRGRHKVTVVRNTENQHICGQWNIVSKLATGNWYGMFCGDDMSYPNRASSVADIVKDHPTIKGLMTRSDSYDLMPDGTLKQLPRVPNTPPRLIEKGDMDLDLLAYQRHPIFGAGAWWHKSLFDKPLTKAPMDDLLLRWVLQMHEFGNANEVWLSYKDLYLLKYIRGEGITSEMLVSMPQKNGINRWMADNQAGKKLSKVFVRSYIGVREYATQYGYYDKFGPHIESALLPHMITTSNTFGKIMLLARMFKLMFTKSVPSVRKLKLIETWFKYFVQEFFGQHFAAFVSVKLLGK